MPFENNTAQATLTNVQSKLKLDEKNINKPFDQTALKDLADLLGNTQNPHNFGKLDALKFCVQFAKTCIDADKIDFAEQILKMADQKEIGSIKHRGNEFKNELKNINELLIFCGDILQFKQALKNADVAQINILLEKEHIKNHAKTAAFNFIFEEVIKNNKIKTEHLIVIQILLNKANAVLKLASFKDFQEFLLRYPEIESMNAIEANLTDQNDDDGFIILNLNPEAIVACLLMMGAKKPEELKKFLRGINLSLNQSADPILQKLFPTDAKLDAKATARVLPSTVAPPTAGVGAVTAATDAVAPTPKSAAAPATLSGP